MMMRPPNPSLGRDYRIERRIPMAPVRRPTRVDRRHGSAVLARFLAVARLGGGRARLRRGLGFLRRLDLGRGGRELEARLPVLQADVDLAAAGELAEQQLFGERL